MSICQDETGAAWHHNQETLVEEAEADGAVNGSLNGFEDDVSMFQAE